MRFAGYAVFALVLVASLSLEGCGSGIEEVREVAASPPPEEMALPEPRLKGVLSLEEALVRRRSVRSFAEEELALEEISQNSGVLYDPEVVDVCVKLFTEQGFKFESE